MSQHRLDRPRETIEQRLAAVWSELLGTASVGARDELVGLGADVSRAAILAARLREMFRVDLAPDELLSAGTIDEQVRLVEARLVGRAQAAAGNHAGAATPRLRPRPQERAEPFPLTPLQEALWIGRGDAVELGNVGCHGYFEWEDIGLDLGRFRQAWQRLIARHDMLRAVIRPDGRQQVLRDPGPFEVPVLDLRSKPAPIVEEQLLSLRDAMSHAVFPPERWPLFDVRATLLPHGRTRLHLGIDLLILDAWSYYQVLLPDLIWFYEHPHGELPPLEITFRDYVIALFEGQASTEAYQRSREYWSKQLATLPPAPDLPRVHSRSASGLRFTRHALRLEAEQWKRLKAGAQREGLTPSGVLAAGYAEVLRTWSTSDAFTLNLPLFDRLPLHPQINQLVGDFTNVCLVPIERADGTLGERMRAVQRAIFTSLEYRHYGGVRILRELGRCHAGVSRAVMPIVFNALLGHPSRRFLTPLGREVFAVSQTPQVLIDNQVSELTDGALTLNWDAQEAAFPPGLIDEMFAAYRGLLTRLADDERTWGQVDSSLTPPAQLAQRALVNRTETAIPQVLLHELMAEQARQRPGRTAVTTPHARLSYRELAQRANQVGRVLRDLGATPNRLVAIVMNKGWEQYVGVYGVLASGAAYLPIDPDVPAERLRWLLDDAEVRIALTQSWLARRLNWPESIRLLCVDTDFDGVDNAPLGAIQRPTDLAYVISTSGSTGRPKGVMVDHRGVANLVCDVNRRFQISPADRAFALSGLHFDASVYDMFGPIAAGAAVVLPGPLDRPEPAHWAEQIATKRVTFWNSVPALMEMLVGHVEGGEERPLRTLRVVVLSGDWIPVSLPARLRAQADNVRIIGAGGPTETICWSILHPIEDIDLRRTTSIPYGKPMSNHRYHVLDERLHHRPVWVPGEIASSSEVGLAKGYWHDEERTLAKFRTLHDTGERVYLSGDIGRYLPDGTIEILGRDDFQVKIQGHRIELGEIEATMREHPSVESAVVVTPEGEGGARHLAAFAVRRAQAGTAHPDDAKLRRSDDELRRFLAQKLPTAMVPATVTLLEALPYTRNGKVDRLALTELAATTRPESVRFVTPRTPLEQVIARLYAQLVGVERVGAQDNLFDLGGDSLAATRLAGRLQDLFGVTVTTRSLFTSPTVAEVAELLVATGADHEQVLGMAAALIKLTSADLERLRTEPDLDRAD